VKKFPARKRYAELEAELHVLNSAMRKGQLSAKCSDRLSEGGMSRLDKRIILKLIFEKWDGAWTGSISFNSGLLLMR
jgi:hypothetical protein